MAEPLRNDIYGESTRYPEPSPTAEVPPQLPGMPAPLPLGARAEDEDDATPGIKDRALDATRETAAKARERLQVVAGQAKRQMNDLAERASDIAGQAGERASQLKDAAFEKVSDVRETLNERLPVWRRQAQDGVRTAQVRARETSHRYPLQVIAGAAAFGFLLGFALRFWRSKRG